MDALASLLDDIFVGRRLAGLHSVRQLTVVIRAGRYDEGVE
jgi:hypothetical protein